MVIMDFSDLRHSTPDFELRNFGSAAGGEGWPADECVAAVATADRILLIPKPRTPPTPLCAGGGLYRRRKIVAAKPAGRAEWVYL